MKPAREDYSERYPEHAKMRAVKRESQGIGEFLEWLSERGEPICVAIDCVNGVRFLPAERSTEQTLALYFGIDLDAIEEEKNAMVEEMRAAQAPPEATATSPKPADGPRDTDNGSP